MAIRCGGRSSSKQAFTIAALIEIMPAARTQCRNRPLVIAPGKTKRIPLQIGMMQFRFGDIRHDTTLRSADDFVGFKFLTDRFGDEKGGDRRAVVVQEILYQFLRIDLEFVDQQ